MMDITRKERTNLMTEITELATVMKNSMEHAAVMYDITEHYGTCNRNEEHYGTTITAYIMDLKLEWKVVQA